MLTRPGMPVGNLRTRTMHHLVMPRGLPTVRLAFATLGLLAALSPTAHAQFGAATAGGAFKDDTSDDEKSRATARPQSGAKIQRPPTGMQIQAPAAAPTGASPERVQLPQGSRKLNVQISGTSAMTTISWTFPAAPIVNASLLRPGQTAGAPAPRPDVHVARCAPAGGQCAWPWRHVPNASQVVDLTAEPGKTYVYTVSSSDRAYETAVNYTVPLPKHPDNLNVSRASDGGLLLNWPEVPGVTKYRLCAGSTRQQRLEPTVDVSATEWRAPPAFGGKELWTVTSLYEREGRYIDLNREECQGAEARLAELNTPDMYYLRMGTFTIHTGNDNKEMLSRFTIRLTINDNQNTSENAAAENHVTTVNGSESAELKVNSTSDFKFATQYNSAASQFNNLARIQRHGLKIVITYLPNFVLDAWKIDRVMLTVSFQKQSQFGKPFFSPGMENQTMTFPVARLLTERNSEIVLLTDGSLRPISP